MVFSLTNMNPAPLQKCTGLINEILIFLVWCFSDFTALTGIRNKHRHQLLAKNKGPGEAFVVVFCGVPEFALPVPRSEVVTEPSLTLPAVGPVEGELGPLPARRPHCWLAVCKIIFHPIAG